MSYLKVLWKTLWSLGYYRRIYQGFLADKSDIFTQPFSLSRARQRLTHNHNTATPTLTHSPPSSEINRLFHTIHNPNSNNNFIIRKAQNAPIN
jgi:hypothetical protein